MIVLVSAKAKTTTLRGAVVMFGILSAASFAHAAPPPDPAKEQEKAERAECAAAYEQTQRLQQKSELMDARKEAERCAQSSCPKLLSEECSKWVTEIDAKLPRLVVRTRAGDACMRSDAKIEIPGSRKSANPSEADVILVDVGVHDIVVTDPVSGKTKTQQINFAAGERRDIDIDFAAPDAVCGQPVTKVTGFGKIPKLTLILGSIGGGLIVVGATVGLIGVVKRSDLDDCKPNCSSDEIDGVRPFFIAGDVLAGFGLLTLGAAAVTYFARDKSATEPKAKAAGRIYWGGSGVYGTF